MAKASARLRLPAMLPSVGWRGSTSGESLATTGDLQKVFHVTKSPQDVLRLYHCVFFRCYGMRREREGHLRRLCNWRWWRDAGFADSSRSTDDAPGDDGVFCPGGKEETGQFAMA